MKEHNIKKGGTIMDNIIIRVADLYDMARKLQKAKMTFVQISLLDAEDDQPAFHFPVSLIETATMMKILAILRNPPKFCRIDLLPIPESYI